MKVASGMAAGQRPQPELAAAAVTAALAKAGLEQAGRVILFLSRDFQRDPRAALLAAARAAGCLDISGCTAEGVFSDEGWRLDQSAAVALVIAAPSATKTAESRHRLSFTAHSTLPFDWRRPPQRVGILSSEAAVWAHGRVQESGNAEFDLRGVQSRLVISTGLRPLGESLTVDACRSHDLLKIDGQTALDTLRRHLPGERRQRLAVHHFAAIRRAGDPGVAILAANDDGSLTMAEAFTPGETLRWAMRQPQGAEQEMSETLSAAVSGEKMPDFAIMFSCIGRGPLFYGDQDRDLAIFHQQLPATPLIGAYGGGQIAPGCTGNCLFQNSVLTLLCESTDVQP
jgi:small ligand-binding sensory domain FIST